jgi:ERCC4-related helicase
VVVSAPPEQGQLVEVRSRQWVVAEIARSTLPTSLARGNGDSPQHLVTLSSVEDDALGEELQVVWELEPGAHARERSALPEPSGFDEPGRLDAFLDAVRWGAVSSADVRRLQAPFRSGIDIEDYQLDPVARAIQMPRVSLLIADDVGLGKTIETGLVALELILRHRARKILVVCPAPLQVQWRDQMRDKFGLELRIVDSALLRELRRTRGIHANPWTHFPRLIVSVDYLKRDRPFRLLRDVLPKPGESTYPRRFDLLIVDEAQNIAPSGRGQYAVDSDRTRAVQAIAPHFEHRLFLSATPHNGYPESFTALLEMLDDQRFARGIVPNRDQLATIMVRRLKSELPPRWDGTPRFPERKLEPIEVAYPEPEREAHALLREYATLRAKRAAEGDAQERVASEFVLKLLKKRLFSSPQAFLRTIEQHRQTMLTGRSASRTLEHRPSVSLLRQQLEQAEEEEYDDDWAYDEQEDDAITVATRLFQPLQADEIALLDHLHRWAEDSVGRPDAKATELLRWLERTLRPDGTWNDERVIIFTEYRDTQAWLQQQLATAGLTLDGRLLTLYGGMETDDRERIKAAFQASPQDSPVRILLATDAASEGIDLQNHCHRLIHYEIPWNPNRLEQRNGRIDRHGQRAADVLVYHFVGAGYRARAGGLGLPAGQLDGDLEFLMRAAEKVEQIRQDLGKVGPVIAQQVEDAMLGRRRSLDTVAAERSAAPAREMLRARHRIDEQVERLRQQLEQSRIDLRRAPENVEAVVQIALDLAGQPPLRQTTLTGVWPDPDRIRTRCPVFELPPLRGSWSRCSEGLAHPHTQKLRPITFDAEIAQGRDDVVLAHLNHPLVQQCLRLLRAEIWSTTDRPASTSVGAPLAAPSLPLSAPERGSGGEVRLHRVTARLIPSRLSDVPIVVAHGRLVIVGGDAHRLHEELIAAAGEIREGRLVRLGVGRTRELLDAALPSAAPPRMQSALAGVWPSLRGPLLTALEARMREVATSQERLLADRAAKEEADVRALLEELRRSIAAELAPSPERQLALEGFGRDERLQHQRDRHELQLRLEKIPAEIEQEVAQVRARYADVTPRLFPVAVTFLVPERLAHDMRQGGR